MFKIGDDPAWAETGLVDRGWRTNVPKNEGIFWARIGIEVHPEDATPNIGLEVEAVGAFELYWDGELIGRNGRVGSTASEEVPGVLRRTFDLIPAHAKPGLHQIAMRVSRHYDERTSNFWVRVVDTEAVRVRWKSTTAVFYLFAGILLLAGIFLCVLYVAPYRDLENLLFGVLTLLVACLLAIEYSRFVLDYRYSWHVPRLRVIRLNTATVAFLLPFFVAEHLRLASRRVRVAIALVPLLPLLESDFDPEALHMMVASLTLSLILSLWGVSRKRHGSAILAVGVAVCLAPSIGSGFMYADHWFFMGYVGMTLIFLAQVVRRLARNERERREALRRVISLRNDLLRKTIQPHFIMNALAASTSYMETAPARGLMLLRSLGEQLRGFFEAGQRSTLPLAEELDLCRSHVESMSHMLDRSIEFRPCNLTLACEVPSGMLLTLVENAVTHGNFERGGEIVITESRGGGTRSYEVTNPSGKNVTEARRDGTGLAYVRSRVEELWPGAWALESQLEGNRWVTRVSLPSSGKHPVPARIEPA